MKITKKTYIKSFNGIYKTYTIKGQYCEYDIYYYEHNNYIYYCEYENNYFNYYRYKNFNEFYNEVLFYYEHCVID